MAIDDRDRLPIDNLPKRQKTPQNDEPPRLSHDSYSVAWICALPIEMGAAQAMLDETHQSLPIDVDDTNTYVLGRIAKHNVVIACLPATQYGTNNAANVATNLTRTFPSIRASLMVGIGGGVPGKSEIRLGDVVVGTRVMQYDLGKMVGAGQLQRTAVPRIPHHLLGTAVSSLRAKHELGPSRVSAILQEKLRRYPGYARPALPDLLFEATYDHVSSTANCDECNQSRLLPRGRRVQDDVVIHYGAIASGNQVMRSGKMRDEVASQLDVICFEMEAVGVMTAFPCLPIRGICDYSDSHKTKEWQGYAAGSAAAYATELLWVLPVSTKHTRGCVPDNCLTREHRKGLLDTLRFDQMENRGRSIENAHAKTCEWLLDHPEYNAWNNQVKRSQHNGILWISGKPGAGKSTLMKFAFLEMKTQASSQNFITASFFFNARGELLEKSVFGMYRSLLLQLLEGYPDLQIVLDNQDLVSLNQENCPPLNVLKNLLSNAILRLRDRPFVCFVDALDECDEQQVVDMVWYFEELAEESTSVGVQFQICFSSRHYPYITIDRGVRLTLEDQIGHAADIESYVDSRLRIKDNALLRELRPKILAKAAGVFMWTVLVVDILNKEYRRGGLALRKRLAELPGDLSQLFRDILRRDTEDMEQFVLATLWILYAQRPLRPVEFRHALSCGLWRMDLVDSQIPDTTTAGTGEETGGLEIFVVTASKGLAEVTKSTKPTVQFIHESVRDFLVKDKGLLDLCDDLGVDFESSGHDRLKQCCYDYLNAKPLRSSVDEMQQTEDVSDEERSLLQQRYPFLKYATRRILYHANAAAKAIPQDDFLSTFSISSCVRTANIFERDKAQHLTLNASMFYYLAQEGHSELIRTRLRRDPHVHVPGERYKYPLFAALANGNSDAAAALLKLPSKIRNGVDITQGMRKREDLKDFESRTPLSWAAQEGRITMVEVLLQSGVAVDETDARERTPLSCACEMGMESVAELLIRSDADINASNPNGETPFGWACVNGHLAVAELLVERGATLNIRDVDGETPLFWAARKWDQNIARLLLDKGADVNARDDSGDTPLLLAAQEGPVFYGMYKNPKAYGLARSVYAFLDTSTFIRHDQAPLCKLLIDNGADVNMINSEGDSALSVSATNGRNDVVSLLIAKGSNVNSRDKVGRTPLLRAAAHGHEATTRLLLENGAHVNSRDQYGCTPLLVGSAAAGERGVVKLLLEEGANPNSRDLNDSSPLHKAALFGHADVCMLLMQNGADVNAKNGHGVTPIKAALKWGHQAVAELLLKNGASLL